MPGNQQKRKDNMGFNSGITTDDLLVKHIYTKEKNTQENYVPHLKSHWSSSVIHD